MRNDTTTSYKYAMWYPYFGNESFCEAAHHCDEVPKVPEIPKEVLEKFDALIMNSFLIIHAKSNFITINKISLLSVKYYLNSNRKDFQQTFNRE